MSSSCKKVFTIPELLDLITAHLNRNDVLNFVLTNKMMLKRVTPLLYRKLEKHFTKVFRIFTSIPALHALARNVQHVRTLKVGDDELAYLYDCVLAFEDLNSLTLDTPLSQPVWFPPSDIRSCQVVALPPMTMLSVLELHLRPCGTHYPYSVSSASTSQANLARLSWLISLNPGLTSLTLHDFHIKDLRDGRIFGGALAGLSKLRSLTFWMYCMSSDWTKLLSCIFYSCRPSIQQLIMVFREEWSYQVAKDADELEEQWRNESVVTAARRQQPLVNLVELSLSTPHDFEWKSGADLRSMFTHCPNIKHLSMEVNLVAGKKEITSMGQFIGRGCPNIEKLSYGCDDAEVHDQLGYSILNSLPAQQVVDFTYTGVISTRHMSAITISILQHSTSLREIHLTGAYSFDKISASAIFRECRNLEIFYIGLLYTGGLCISLDDALEHPWACTKLTHLILAISGCALPYQPGVLEYFRRPTPIAITEVEGQHFARLEELYRRIGALKELRELDLSMTSIDEDGQMDTQCIEGALSFPAMLNLKDARKGRPGCLQLLSGLKKLEVLRGSVCAWTEETKVTMEWPEVVWMDQNWPNLCQANFFLGEHDVSEPFAWLRERRQGSGQGLRIVSDIVDMYE